MDPTGNLITAAFEIHKDINLGGALKIYLTDKVTSGNTIEVHVSYSTNANSIAINWLTPA